MHQKRKQGLPLWAAVAAVLFVCASLLAITRSVNAKQEQEEAVPSSESASEADSLPPGAMAELEQANQVNDQIEKQTLQLLNTNLDTIHQIQTLGKLEIFDKTLSVGRNESCSTCHTPTTGFTGPSQILNLTTVAYPGSVQSMWHSALRIFSDRRLRASYMSSWRHKIP